MRAPVAMFVHARPQHSIRTLESLVRNTGADETHIYIYSDGARDANELIQVMEVRRIIYDAWSFASVTVIERESNWGLARNIRDGVSTIVEEHGKVIVIEDDLVTSPLFLQFMNNALDRYENSSEVWHINGWTYPVPTQADNSAYFTSIMECWGWATWRDRWQKVVWDPESFTRNWNAAKIRRFNIDGGYDSWTDLKRNATGLIRTWAVFWYASIFDRGGLCLSPPVSFVKNVGIDGSGNNSGDYDRYSDTVLAMQMPENWPENLTVDEAAWQKVSKFLRYRRAPLWRRVASKVRWQLKAVSSMLAKRTNFKSGNPTVTTIPLSKVRKP